ncbi:AraC family ligand binding domain-containing protein [Arthrobacter sp. ERGS1:01]|uniref:AraC family ligand binding domain-containing protein n=1 Tax=Arthrobacter sp. ERGS1:01 TaxID=1704044 RepID=UPI0006B4F5F5|nr:helix-turn-helix transcriptional regulator [Arthrobacter sp. ERGS1:01]
MPLLGTTDLHRHDGHQILSAGSGVLGAITDAGAWFSPATRALWIPAGTAHHWRAHGHLAVHMLGLPASENPLSLDEPTVLIVSPLLRELLLQCPANPTITTPQADPADDRTLGALGTEAWASERTLSRLFRSELGMMFPQ